MGSDVMLMESDERFGELRSALHRKPSRGGWRRITSLCEKWPDEEAFQQTILPYVLGLLSSWPDEYREVPWQWLLRLFEEDREPALALAKTLSIKINRADVEQCKIPLSFSNIKPEWMKAMVEEEWLSGVTIANFEGCLSSMCLDVLSGSQGWRHLERLLIGENDFGDDSPASLWRWVSRRPVRVLGVGASFYGSLEVDDLVRFGVMKRLESLDVSYSVCEEEELRVLLDAQNAQSLRHLNVSGIEALTSWETDEEFMVRFVEWMKAPNLDSLVFQELGLFDEMLEVLFRAPWIGQLKSLDISWNDCHSFELAALLDDEDSELRLESLDLRYNEVYEDDLLDLSKAKGLQFLKKFRSLTDTEEPEDRGAIWAEIGEGGWPSLESLECGSLKYLGEEGMARWVETKMAHRLKELIIPADLEMPLLEEGWATPVLKPLASAELPELRRLELNEIPLDETNLGELASCWKLTGVEHLGLRQNECTDEVVGVLCAHDAFAELDVLDMRANLRMSADAIEMLRTHERFRSCEVVWIDVTANDR